MLKVMEKRVEGQFSPARIFAWVIDMKHLVENAPRRREMILDKMANDQMTVQLEVAHFDQAIKSINRAANRLSISILAASFIIGGKLMWDTLQKTSPQDKKKRE
jgi:t-SNARE complex subunit (syntaxin)